MWRRPSSPRSKESTTTRHQREDFEPDNRSRRPLQREGRLFTKPLRPHLDTCPRTRTSSPLFMHIHLAERRQALRQREPPTQGCAPPTCVCSRLLFLHPTQAAFNGEDQKVVSTILATDKLSQLPLLSSQPNGLARLACGAALSSKPDGKIKTQKKPKEFRTRTAGFCGERQDKQTRTKARRSHGERGLSVEKCFTAQ